MPTTTEIDFADLHQMLTNTRDVTEAAAILAERQASELADSLEGPDVTHALRLTRLAGSLEAVRGAVGECIEDVRVAGQLEGVGPSP